MIEVIVIDDHALIREGVTALLSATGDIRVTGHATNAAEGVRLARTSEWDVAIAEPALCDDPGTQLIERLCRARPAGAVLALSIKPDMHLVWRCLRAGALGFVGRHDSPDELIEAVRRVAVGSRYLSTRLAAEVALFISNGIDQSPLGLLDRDEIEVLSLLAIGHSVRDISSMLARSTKTIAAQRARLLEKLDLQTTADLIRYAVENGLVA